MSASLNVIDYEGLLTSPYLIYRGYIDVVPTLGCTGLWWTVAVHCSPPQTSHVTAFLWLAHGPRIVKRPLPSLGLPSWAALGRLEGQSAQYDATPLGVIESWADRRV